MDVAPKEEAEEDVASGAMHGAPSAERASDGGMATGGQGSGMGASGGPTEFTAASKTTTEQVLVGVSSVVAIQTVAAAKGSVTGNGGTVGADVMKA